VNVCLVMRVGIELVSRNRVLYGLPGRMLIWWNIVFSPGGRWLWLMRYISFEVSSILA
jgi:hypothetical protein